MLSFLTIFVLMLFVLTNIVIGCFTATLLGYGPPDWKAALKMFVDVDQIQEMIDALWNRLAAFLPIQKRERRQPEPSKEQLVPVVASDAPAAETFSQVIRKLSVTEVGDLLDDEAEEAIDLASMQEIFDDNLASLLMEQGTETWFVNEKHIETSLLKLNLVMMKSGKFAADLDWRIRNARGSLQSGDIRQFRDELRDDCVNYLESQAEITDQMKKRLDEFGELKNLAEDVDFANMEGSSQIETTISNLDRMDLSKAPDMLANNLIKELANLRVARHRLRDLQDRTFMKIVAYENRLDTVPKQLFYDENFGIRGRIGLDAAVHEWWRQKRHQSRQITFALLDFVKFGDANQEYGIAVCDRIIKEFGQSLTEQFDPMDLIGIYTGNCFMVATVNAGPKKTITEIERIRQRSELTMYQFNSGNNSVTLQLTCGITEALDSQSSEEVLAALEKTLAAAKKAGRNLTFHYVPSPLNKPPELVEAPSFGKEPRTITLADI